MGEVRRDEPHETLSKGGMGLGITCGAEVSESCPAMV
jgi:hypothetical protein